MISEVLVFPGSILLWRRNTEVPWKPKPRPPVGAGIRGYASLGRPRTGRRWRNSLPITWSISGALWLKALVKAKALWQHQPGRPGPSETHEKSMRNPGNLSKRYQGNIGRCFVGPHGALEWLQRGFSTPIC